MSYATIDVLRSQLGGKPPKAELSAEYTAKMLHDLPAPKTVDRAVFILKHVVGKRVLEFGASGPMHEEVRKASVAYMGVDREDGDHVVGFNLDDVSQQSLPAFNPEIIVCGEVLEHLSNPGWFLTRMKAQYAGVPVIITVPNAFSSLGRGWLAKGKENVNIDHVSWYSPRTLATLLSRAGYTYADLFYYNGEGPTAEGLIVVTE
jgi:hypothetical protein